MCFIAEGVTLDLNRSCMPIRVSPAARRLRISITSVTVSFLKRLPFAVASAMLSHCVPGNKWSGRTQAGLSQWWHRNFSVQPTPMKYEARCALISFCVAIFHATPYPFLRIFPVHNQHGPSSGLRCGVGPSLLTFFQKLRSSSGD